MTNNITIDQIPGYASQVHSGWVWINGSNELRWSKAATQEQCENIVLEACQRLGIEGAIEE